MTDRRIGCIGCIGNSCFYQPLYPRVQLPRQRGVAGAEIGMIHDIRPHVRGKDVAQSRGASLNHRFLAMLDATHHPNNVCHKLEVLAPTVVARLDLDHQQTHLLHGANVAPDRGVDLP